MDKPKEIVIFKKAYELSLEVFRCTKLFPKSQRFLMAQHLVFFAQEENTG